MPTVRMVMPKKAAVERAGMPEARDRMLRRRMVSDRRMSKRELRELIEQREYELRAE